MNLLDDLLKEVRELHPDFDLEPLKKAYDLATRLHAHQVRKSGEPYIVHPVEVVRIILKMRLDLPSLVAGLLHDTVEDTFLTIEEIQKEFGVDVATLVDGVTKLSKLSFHSKLSAQAENFRKMVIAMSKDLRVILIKLADRLHNMRTLQYMSSQKQIDIAQETLDIYAPLAHRMGIAWVKSELEDLSIRYLKPDVYFRLVELVAQSKKSRQKYIDDVIEILNRRLKESGLETFEVTGRPKNFYSIYEKMDKQEATFEEIHDLIAFRIITDDIKSCYQALGLVHSMWKPVPGRFKDYIAMPKANLYQSLHTTVIGPMGQRVEIQIRTVEMHQISEYGIAAHWQYKKDGSVDKKDFDKFGWLRRLVEDQEIKDPSEFLDSVKVDLFEEEVFAFSPKGDVVTLVRGATTVDFAYAIHSKVGDHCVGAKVNGRIVPLRHKLQNGDEVEIITSEAQTPRKDWLEFTVTSRARSKIRAMIKKQQSQKSYEIGEKILDKEFRRQGHSFSKLLKKGTLTPFLSHYGAANEEDLIIKVGYGKFEAPDVARTLLKLCGLESSAAEEVKEDDSTGSIIKQIFSRAKKKSSRSPVLVQGIDNMLVRMAKCCTPIPGEPIVGFVSRGRGISVHAANCQKGLTFDNARKVDIDWDPQAQSDFPVPIKIITVDKPGILAKITHTITAQGGNIGNAKVQTTNDNRAQIFIEVNIQNVRQLQTMLSKLETIDGIVSARRDKED